MNFRQSLYQDKIYPKVSRFRVAHDFQLRLFLFRRLNFTDARQFVGKILRHKRSHVGCRTFLSGVGNAKSLSLTALRGCARAEKPRSGECVRIVSQTRRIDN